MDWWTQLGNMTAFLQGAPALAADMTLRGPKLEALGYGLARNLNATPVPFEVYPPEETPLPAPMEG